MNTYQLSAAFLLWLSVSFSAPSISYATDKVAVSDFSRQSLQGWKQHRFHSSTDYRLQQLKGEWVLAASSSAAASAFYRKIEIDLDKTPILSWRWRVEKPLQGLDETRKSGDDYAARVYVVQQRGLISQGLAINYVWSSSHDKGSSWPNAYALKSSKMLALQDARSPLGEWQQESRNVREDFKALLGVELHKLQLLVLMTDTDNSGQSALAHYGDLVFSSD